MKVFAALSLSSPDVTSLPGVPGASVPQAAVPERPMPAAIPTIASCRIREFMSVPSAGLVPRPWQMFGLLRN